MRVSVPINLSPVDGGIFVTEEDGQRRDEVRSPDTGLMSVPWGVRNKNVSKYVY